MLRYLMVLFVVLKVTKVWAASSYIKSRKVGGRHVDRAPGKAASEERGEDFAGDSCVVC